MSKWLDYADMRKQYERPAGLREYRRYTSIHWGQHYNPETQAHHVMAASYESANKSLPWTMGARGSTQVKVAGEWHWVEDESELFGGTKAA